MRKAVLGTLKILVPIALGIWLVLYFYRQLDERQRSELFTAFGLPKRTSTISEVSPWTRT